MADMFGRSEIDYGGTFDSQRVRINLNGITGGLLGTGFQATYAQEITRMWALNSQKTFFVAGRTQGNFGIDTIAGPSQGSNSAFISRYGNPCSIGGQFSVSSAGGWCGGQGSGSGNGITVKNPLVQSVGMRVAVQDMMLQQSVQGMFVSATTT